MKAIMKRSTKYRAKRFFLLAYLILGTIVLGCSEPSDEKSGDQVVPQGENGANQGFGPSSGTPVLPQGSGGCRDLQDNFNSSTTAQGAAAVPILGNINFSLNVNAQVQIQSNESQGIVGINGQVVSANPALAKGLAEKAIGAYRDPLRLELVPTTEQGSLPGWEGLDCVVAGVRSISNNAMEFRYDPPIPFLALPQAGQAQVGSRQFQNINATVVRHFEQQATPGSYPGSATMTQQGNKVNIQFNFGDRIPQLFSTPVASVSYEIAGTNFNELAVEIYVSEGSKVPLVLRKQGGAGP